MTRDATLAGVRGYVRAAVRLARNRGMVALLLKGIEITYNTLVRPLLPTHEPRRSEVTHVARAPHRYGDGIVPWRVPSQFSLDQERALRTALSSVVNEGDHVVIIGGGSGISATVAAKMAGEAGDVTVFEATAKNCRRVEQTVAVNGVGQRVSVTHAVVGRYTGHAWESYGFPDGASTITVDDLPDCDVLELDCEGSETQILRTLAHNPRHIVVETHGFIGYPTHETADLLEERGYEIHDQLIENRELGVDVLVAKR